MYFSTSRVNNESVIVGTGEIYQRLVKLKLADYDDMHAKKMID